MQDALINFSDPSCTHQDACIRIEPSVDLANPALTFLQQHFLTYATDPVSFEIRVPRKVFHEKAQRPNMAPRIILQGQRDTLLIGIDGRTAFCAHERGDDIHLYPAVLFSTHLSTMTEALRLGTPLQIFPDQINALSCQIADITEKVAGCAATSGWPAALMAIPDPLGSENASSFLDGSLGLVLSRLTDLLPNFSIDNLHIQGIRLPQTGGPIVFNVVLNSWVSGSLDTFERHVQQRLSVFLSDFLQNLCPEQSRMCRLLGLNHVWPGMNAKTSAQSTINKDGLSLEDAGSHLSRHDLLEIEDVLEPLMEKLVEYLQTSGVPLQSH